MTRVHNFCAGPCTLPVSVLEQLGDQMADFDESGMSLVEMSHRSSEYDEVHHRTLDLLRSLCSVPDDFDVLLIQGGATLQFAMIPMNLLSVGDTAGHAVTGTWGKGAFADGSAVGDVYAAWHGEQHNYARMPLADELDVREGTRYVHVTSNETIGGIRMPDLYALDVPQVADMSSDFLTREIPWDNYDLVYGGAQKNLGPAGVAVVFIRKSLMDPKRTHLPKYLRYDVHAEADSLANTPPMFSIWAMGLMLAWIDTNGGVAGMQQRAAERSSTLYDLIDSSDGFYRSPVAKGDRSHTNIVFRLGDADLEATFLTQAEQHGLMNLKGHRSVGGIRASVYNALPTESVEALADYMRSFAGGQA
ncbi:MAG: 3-phosphoserine/phosphohydroxythreonine transaminase [Actinomycetia bacterium]|nr:3-phosphoserine/phosphohydroxythreonine transaminase [Actinomycetes bacterium]